MDASDVLFFHHDQCSTDQWPTSDICKITVDCSADLWTLRVRGSLDLASGRQLLELGAVLGAGDAAQVALDLSDVDFIDTGGLHAVARTCALVRSGGGRVTLTGATSPALARLLHALDQAGQPVTLDQRGWAG